MSQAAMTDKEAHEALYGSTTHVQNAACAALYDRHAPWLAAALRSRHFRPDEIETGVNDAFLRLFKVLTQEADFPAGEQRRLRAWLFSAGEQAAIDEVRRVRETRRIARTVHFSQFATEESELAFEAFDFRTPTAEQHVAAHDFCQKLRTVWTSLSKMDKVILIVDTTLIATLDEVSGEDWDAHDEDLSAELAEYVVLASTVRRQRLKRLRDRLKELFKEREDE